MAYSWSEQVVPSGTTLISVDIEYLDKSYIYLYINNVLISNSDYSWNSDTLIQLNTPMASAGTVLLVRRTDKEYLYIMFAEGAAFIRENLDVQNTQFLHLAQELVEGRSIDGFYGDLSMNGYRITHLADGVDPKDAVNKGQLDSVSNRVSSIENSFLGLTTVSYPWYTVVSADTDTFEPPFKFTKAALYIDGLCQVPDYSYVVVDNKLLLAESVPTGTVVFARLGEDTDAATEAATTTALAAVQADLQNQINALRALLQGG
ncbi:tail fiber protein [Shigella phage Buco]|uniref:Putative tail protein n=1 Tax=Shigella phage Buco TaxID=2530183 RepID=A0A482JMG8_9CAUD|nr:tail fiber protein [Shigella phage Buco]QBP32944.1 putative tail protein [Shigella phage Buco]8ES4_F Chain F, Gp44 [Shigella phage Buco]8ES4_G Chain G, Gp44 [Shigella phage Buco]8ES4_H Chain H, Gp44 [Shigella phage Buco]